jgi:acetyl esterase/lipase
MGRMNTRLIHSVLALALTQITLMAEPAKPLVLWPKEAPKEAGNLGEEKDTTNEKGGLVAGKRVIRLGNVSQPTLTFYPAPADRNTGAAVLICPGGGYQILAMDLEGTEVAEWLNTIGVNALLLKYRVPARQGRERWEAPLEDAQRALSLARSRSKAWGIDPKRIGMMGFSAGAHLSAVLSSKYAQRHYAPVDAADQESCKPDFVMLIYPAYLTVQKENDKIAPELTINQDTPPTLLVQTQDDGIRVECSVFYYLALKQAKVPVEMHLYPSGGHGYGLRPTEKTVTSWPKRAEEWMKASGWLMKK